MKCPFVVCCVGSTRADHRYSREMHVEVMVMIRGIRNPGVRRCLGFCSADSKANQDQKSAVQKPKHCPTCDPSNYLQKVPPRRRFRPEENQDGKWRGHPGPRACAGNHKSRDLKQIILAISKKFAKTYHLA